MLSLNWWVVEPWLLWDSRPLQNIMTVLINYSTDCISLYRRWQPVVSGDLHCDQPAPRQNLLAPSAGKLCNPAQSLYTESYWFNNGKSRVGGRKQKSNNQKLHRNLLNYTVHYRTQPNLLTTMGFSVPEQTLRNFWVSHKMPSSLCCYLRSIAFDYI